MAFVHSPDTVLSFFKNNPNASLPKIHIDLSSEIKELFFLESSHIRTHKNRPRGQ